MRSFIILLCLIPTLLFARQSQLKTLLEQAIKGKKAEIGIAVIIDGKDTVTVNNDIQYPLMSVFKFHQAVALADYMDKKRLPLGTLLSIKKSDLKPNTYSPLRDQFPQGGFEMSIADLLKYTLQQSDNMLVIFFSIIKAGRILSTGIYNHWGFVIARSLIQRTICTKT